MLLLIAHIMFYCTITCFMSKHSMMDWWSNGMYVCNYLHMDVWNYIQKVDTFYYGHIGTSRDKCWDHLMGIVTWDVTNGTSKQSYLQWMLYIIYTAWIFNLCFCYKFFQYCVLYFLNWEYIPALRVICLEWKCPN